VKELGVIMILAIFLISCSDRHEIENIPVDKNEIIAVDTILETPNFSERFKSAGKEELIWQYNEEIVPEKYIEKIDDHQLTINGISILAVDSLIEELGLEADNRNSSKETLMLRSNDSTISAGIHNNEISFINLNKGVSVKLFQVNLFDMTFQNYKEAFPGSYSMRNSTTNMSDVIYYQDIDSVKTLDFTELFTKSGKLKLTWANGRVERMEYLYFKW